MCLRLLLLILNLVLQQIWKWLCRNYCKKVFLRVSFVNQWKLIGAALLSLTAEGFLKLPLNPSFVMKTWQKSYRTCLMFTDAQFAPSLFPFRLLTDEVFCCSLTDGPELIFISVSYKPVLVEDVWNYLLRCMYCNYLLVNIIVGISVADSSLFYSSVLVSVLPELWGNKLYNLCLKLIKRWFIVSEIPKKSCGRSEPKPAETVNTVNTSPGWTVGGAAGQRSSTYRKLWHHSSGPDDAISHSDQYHDYQ